MYRNIFILPLFYFLFFCCCCLLLSGLEAGDKQTHTHMQNTTTHFVIFELYIIFYISSGIVSTTTTTKKQNIWKKTPKTTWMFHSLSSQCVRMWVLLFIFLHTRLVCMQALRFIRLANEKIISYLTN